MSDRNASTLPGLLVKRYGTRDPFQLAEALDITILVRDDFHTQKGAFKVILNNCFIFLNGNMSESEQTQVCAHELGHAMLHRDIAARTGGFMEYEIFQMATTMEYDANIFAANLLLADDEVEKLAYSGIDVVAMARELRVNVNLLLIKLNELNKAQHRFNIPAIPKSGFMGSIQDDAGSI